MVARLAWLTGIVVGLALAMARLDAGGWAVVTLKDVPEYMVAGKSVSLTYAVRQHGVHLTPGLSGWIEARDARGGIVKAIATPASDTGYYLAKLTLPTPGDWIVTVVSGFMDSKSGPVAMRVVAGGGEVASDGGRRARQGALCGERLHLVPYAHGRVAEDGLRAGPERTALRGGVFEDVPRRSVDQDAIAARTDHAEPRIDAW